MLDKPASSNEVDDTLHPVGTLTKELFVSIVEAEFERLFGHTGILMVEKAVQDYRGKGEIGPVDVPIIIEVLMETVKDMLSEKKACELRDRIRTRCGLD